jgi:hypothetical protein
MPCGCCGGAIAATLDFDVEPATLEGIGRAPTSSATSRERGDGASKILAAQVPSIGLRLMAETGLLAPISPELAAQRGVPQNKIGRGPLGSHAAGRGRGVPDPLYIRLGRSFTTSASPRRWPR